MASEKFSDLDFVVNFVFTFYIWSVKGLLSTDTVSTINDRIVGCITGFYNAFHVLANEKFSDLDFVVHLGDYYYESPIDGPTSFPFVSDTLSFGVAARVKSFKEHPDYLNGLLVTAPVTLDQFRARHRLTKSDRGARAMHAAHAFIATWCVDDYSTLCYWHKQMNIA